MERPAINDLVQQNIETIARIEQAELVDQSPTDRMVSAISRFVGRIEFVWAQTVFLVLWIGINTIPSIPAAARFDPFPFPALILVLATETIVISTFILISQNRERLISEKRNHLDLQINLLAEQEASQMLTMLQSMMKHMGIDTDHAEVDALREAADPEQMLEQIEASLKLAPEEKDDKSS